MLSFDKLYYISRSALSNTPKASWPHIRSCNRSHHCDIELSYFTFFPGVLPGSLHDAEGSMGGSATPLNPRRRAFLDYVRIRAGATQPPDPIRRNDVVITPQVQAPRCSKGKRALNRSGEQLSTLRRSLHCRIGLGCTSETTGVDLQSPTPPAPPSPHPPIPLPGRPI